MGILVRKTVGQPGKKSADEGHKAPAISGDPFVDALKATFSQVAISVANDLRSDIALDVATMREEHAAAVADMKGDLTTAVAGLRATLSSAVRDLSAAQQTALEQAVSAVEGQAGKLSIAQGRLEEAQTRYSDAVLQTQRSIDEASAAKANFDRAAAESGAQSKAYAKSKEVFDSKLEALNAAISSYESARDKYVQAAEAQTATSSNLVGISDAEQLMVRTAERILGDLQDVDAKVSTAVNTALGKLGLTADVTATLQASHRLVGKAEAAAAEAKKAAAELGPLKELLPLLPLLHPIAEALRGVDLTKVNVTVTVTVADKPVAVETQLPLALPVAVDERLGDVELTGGVVPGEPSARTRNLGEPEPVDAVDAPPKVVARAPVPVPARSEQDLLGDADLAPGGAIVPTEDIGVEDTTAGRSALVGALAARSAQLTAAGAVQAPDAKPSEPLTEPLAQPPRIGLHKLASQDVVLITDEQIAACNDSMELTVALEAVSSKFNAHRGDARFGASSEAQNLDDVATRLAVRLIKLVGDNEAEVQRIKDTSSFSTEVRSVFAAAIISRKQDQMETNFSGRLDAAFQTLKANDAVADAEEIQTRAESLMANGPEMQRTAYLRLVGKLVADAEKYAQKFAKKEGA